MDCWTFARKVMQFLEVGSRCPPEASHGRQPHFLIPEDPCNIAAENPPVIFRFGDAFSEEELSVGGNEHSPTPERLSAKYAITKRCPPIRCLHNRIELHLACLVLFYDLKVIVFSGKSNCRYLGAQV